jgi:hypothetical protein
LVPKEMLGYNLLASFKIKATTGNKAAQFNSMRHNKRKSFLQDAGLYYGVYQLETMSQGKV